MKIAILSINDPSLKSAIKLYPKLRSHQVDIYGKNDLDDSSIKIHTYNKLDDILPDIWDRYDAIIAILAIGAIVRKVAPLLKDKSKDPAVIAINLALDRVVPLLGGHLGGANELSQEIADSLPGCINFISTATDQTGTLSFDTLAQKNGWKILNLHMLASISNRLLNKQHIKVATFAQIFEKLPKSEYLSMCSFDDIDEHTVVIAPHIISPALTLQPRITIGIGCNRDTPADMISNAFDEFLDKHQIDRDLIDKIVSFDAKSDEKGLLEFAQNNGYKIEFFTKDEINSVEGELSKSASTKFFGLKGVAEPSAIFGSTFHQLIFKKEVYYKSITIAGAI